MRQVLAIAVAAVTFGAVVALASTGAKAQYYGGYINQPRGYAPPAYAPPPPSPPPAYTRPRVVVTPPSYGYGSGAYYDYRHFGDPSTRDSLNTCAYC